MTTTDVTSTAAAELTRVLEELVVDPITRFTPSPYETAQYARVGHRTTVRGRQLDYLFAAQRADGAWGEQGFEVIPTLAAIACLDSVGVEDGRPAGEAEAAIGRGARYLWAFLCDGPGLPDLPDTVAAEIIAPSLVELTRPVLRRYRPGTLTVDLPDPGGSNPELYRRFRGLAEGGEQLPRKIWHSLEIFAPLGRGITQSVTTDDGGVACSPAATVAWLAALDGVDPGRETEAYLEEIETRYDGAIPMGSAMTFFEYLWVCNFALKCPSPPPIPQPLLDLFVRNLTGAGIGGGPGLPPDGDDTAYALMVLEKEYGRSDPELLEQFWEGDRFRTYPAEQTPSETTNAHALEYLGLIDRKRGDGRYAATRERCADWLCSVQDDAGFWVDKWHISPYYSTGECLSALLGSGVRTPSVDRAISRAIDWLLGNRSSDGGWGIRSSSTREETAYAVLALHRVDRSGLRPDLDVTQLIDRAADRMRASGDETPPMWMGKDLYRPERVVRAVEAAGLGVVTAYAAKG